MTKLTVLKLIYVYSLASGIDPDVAISVAKVESNLNQSAIGSQGEIGLFQIHPQWARKYSIEQLKNPRVNIKLGIKKLKEAKDICPHQNNLDWLVCYNFGYKNALTVKHPSLFPYVKRVSKEYKKIIANRFQTSYYVHR